MVPDYVLIIGGIVVGFCFVYYLILKLASNAWIGSIPPGPTTPIPFLGCLSVYLSSVELNNTIEENFQKYGCIFQLRCLRQKIVFVDDHQVVYDAMENKEIEYTTIRDFATALHRLGLKYVKRREVAFLTKVWQKHVHQVMQEKCNDVQLINLIADKIYQEDALESIEQGDLISPPERIHRVRMDEFVDPQPCPDTIESLRCLLLECPHLWIGSRLLSIVHFRQHKLKRLKGRYLMDELSDYVQETLNLCSIHTERKFLTFLFILVKMSDKHEYNKTEVALGPDIGGWRSFYCQDYAQIKQYKIPRKSFIYSM